MAVSEYSYSEVDADAEGARQGCSDPSSLHAFKATAGMKCGGLDEDDNPQTLAECKAACCSDPACGIYQYTTVRQHAPSPPPVRTGALYDLHRFAANTPLFLYSYRQHHRPSCVC